MGKLWLLYSIFLMSIVFIAVPMKTEMIDFFPLSDFEIYPVNYVYYIFEKLTVIILAYIIAAEAKQYIEALRMFFLLAVVDFADYLLTYSSVWFHVGSFPISFNIIKIGVFGLVILNEIWKNR